jgi:hypothetical protein
MNNWGIPDWLERKVKERDKTCVYCGIQMIEHMPPRGSRKAAATWEHIINDQRTKGPVPGISNKVFTDANKTVSSEVRAVKSEKRNK